jgi:DnaK suppressor protein
MSRMESVDTERYNTLKAMLGERRSEIQEKLRSLREAMPIEAAQAADAEEQSVNDFVRDIDWALTQMKAESLAKIDQAIQKLEEGTYGSCEDCGTEIAAARLKAVPFADRCIHCQESLEQRGAEDQVTTRVPGRVFEAERVAASQEE